MYLDIIFPVSFIVCVFLGFYLSFRYTYKANRLKSQQERENYR
jgi:uncharacterized protein YneF (UPF0154 family)